mmetsp:Transcript_32503/g.127471  ORF Transcript_32503/g.127471 Transcript_32503/m.127471 type:complete len:156 (-) Transcript_32503:1906-2373(-)
MSKLAAVRANFDSPSSSSKDDGSGDTKKSILVIVGAVGALFLIALTVSATFAVVRMRSCVPKMVDANLGWSDANLTFLPMDFSSERAYFCLHKNKLENAYLNSNDISPSSLPRKHALWSNVTYEGSGGELSNTKFLKSVFTKVSQQLFCSSLFFS